MLKLFFAFVVFCGVVRSQQEFYPPQALRDETSEVSLTGTWANELGSRMHLIQNGQKLDGAFCTAVSSTPIEYINALRGNIGTGRNPSLGFSVTFYRASSKTTVSTKTWSGIYQKLKGVEKILTTWLLSTPPVNPWDAWYATNVGRDEFHRVPDDPGCIIHKKRNPFK